MGRLPALSLATALGAASLSLACTSRGACDGDGVTALLVALEGAEESARPALLRERLPAVCALPPHLAGYLQAHTPVPGGRSVALRSNEEVLLLHREFARLCPDHEALLAEAEELRGLERSTFFYDRCGLSRLGVISRDDHLRHNYGVGVWATYVWLLDQGLEDAQVRALTAALLILDRE